MVIGMKGESAADAALEVVGNLLYGSDVVLCVTDIYIVGSNVETSY